MHMVLDGVYYRAAIDAFRAGPQDELVRARLRAYADAGITYLRDGGDRFGASMRARELAAEYGVEYRVPVFPMCLKGRYGAFIGREFADLDEYRGLIGEIKRQKGDFVKVMISGLVDFDRYGVITSEPMEAGLLREIVNIAHGEGFAVMAHANGAQLVRDALAAGVDSIEHGAYMDGETVAMLAGSGAVWTPTLVTIANLIGCGRYPDGVLERILEGQLRKVALCASLGGKIALGSDNGAYRVLHPQGTLDEYALLKRAVGDRTDAVLAQGEQIIRERFRRG